MFVKINKIQPVDIIGDIKIDFKINFIYNNIYYNEEIYVVNF